MIKAIAAHDDNMVIGFNNTIPWHIKGDFTNFKKVTSGHTVVMGRKTFESIGRPLPNRKNIVLTRDRGWSHAGVEVIHNHEDVLAYTGDVFILGGNELYKIFFPLIGKLYITEVVGSFKGDTYLPEYKNLPGIKETFSSNWFEEDGQKYRFKEYEFNR